ncbi:MAG: DUF4337 domain-containing protein [Acidobacteria bacterium]|nr:DUF4337 domain-containing protein [Acidobacteriota bacterium]
MEPHELSEEIEHANEAGEKRIGLTMAITAVLLAVATMLGHRSHTEEVVLQTRVADQWAFYQARNLRSQMYAADARMAGLNAGEAAKKTAEDFQAESERVRKNAEETQEEARGLERETAAAARRGGIFDLAEIFLEVSIVLCSISLLSRSRMYWLFSFATTAAGIALGIMAFLR